MDEIFKDHEQCCSSRNAISMAGPLLGKHQVGCMHNESVGLSDMDIVQWFTFILIS